MSIEERKSHLEDGELDDEEEENAESVDANLLVNELPSDSVRVPSAVESEAGAAESRDFPPVLDVSPALVIADSLPVMVNPQPIFTTIYDQDEDEEEDDDDDDEYGLGRKRLKIDESEGPVLAPVSLSPVDEEAVKADTGTTSQPATDVLTGFASMSSTSTGQIDIKLDRASVGMTVIDALVDPSTVISVASKQSELAVDAKTTSPVTTRSELEHDNESSSSSAVSAISAISSASLPTSEVSNEGKNAQVAEEKAQPASQEEASKGVSSPVTTAENTATEPQPAANTVASVAAGEPMDIEADAGDMSNAAVISGDTVSSVNSFKSFEETSDKAKSDEQPAQEVSKSEETEPAGASGVLKVPPLKIICSNATGIAYVKSVSEIESEKRSSGDETSGAPEVSDDCSKEKSEPREPDLNSQLSNDSINSTPNTVASSTTTRSKASRTARDISSPVPSATGAGNGSKAATRRPQLPAVVGPVASVGRASPSTNLLASPILTASTSTSGTGFDTTGMTAAEVETANRRKLRSHTRQQQGDPSDPPLTVRSASAGAQSTGTKSPSPVNVLNENTNSNNSTNGNQTGSFDDASKTANPPCECSNDSNMDTSEPVVQPGADLTSSRRRRTRNGAAQAIEPAETEPVSKHLPAISEADSGDAKSTEFVSMTSVEPVNLMTISSSEGTGSTTSSTTETESVAAHDEAIVQQQLQDQQPPVVNCIRKFLELKNEIRKKREAVEGQIEPRLPSNYKDFVLFNRHYLIKSNDVMRHSILINQAPNDLPEELKKFFLKQENERCAMNTRHRVERHKLKIMQEHETLRCYNRLVREAANQTAPFSLCTMIKDEEIYSLYRNIPTEQQLQAILLGTQEPQAPAAEPDPASSAQPASAPPPPSLEEKLSQALNDLETKFAKLREDTAKRQLNESDSLNAVQKMDFQSKLKEFMNKHKHAADSAAAAKHGTSSQEPPPAITLSAPSTTVKN